MADKHGLQAISSARWTEVVTTLATETAKAYTAAEERIVRFQKRAVSW